MKLKFLQIGISFLIPISLVSCKTYFIPIESFKEQMKDIRSVRLRIVNTRGPMGDVHSYKTYPIDFIKCIDNKNNPYELRNSPSIEIRFTEKNNERTIFYFDQIYIKDSTVIGDVSRFIYYRKTIPIENIKLIEVQDGHKNFKYVEKNNNL